MKFHPSLGFEHRQQFQSLVDQLPESSKKVILEYLAWRSAPVSPLDYNMVCTFRDRLRDSSGGPKTEIFLCESLREAIQIHTTIKVFRHHFDGAWKKRVPDPNLKAEAKKIRQEISARSFRERQAAGQTFVPSSKVLRYGYVHRKSGHA